MKSQKMKISTLVGAMALAGAITLPTMAAAEEAKTNFNIFLRLQAELVDADSYNEDGVQFGDGWRFGQSNSGGWGGLFFNISHQLDENTKMVARYARNINNTSSFGDRDQWVGVDSKKFGRLTAGRHNSVYKQTGLGWDPILATFLQARGNQGL
ncbi:MAG TPA: porin, partial [Wenzhouxiangella sp.]|nr:porin [Wenzhouxiangella sp.]